MCRYEDSRVQMSDSMYVRTNIPANINLNVSAYMSADVYVAKLVHGCSLSLISSSLGIRLPGVAQKWREIEPMLFRWFWPENPSPLNFFMIFSLKNRVSQCMVIWPQRPNLVISWIFCNFNKAIAEASNAGRSHSQLFSWWIQCRWGLTGTSCTP